MNSSSASTSSSSSTPSSINSRKSKRANAPEARTDAAWEHAIDLGQRKLKCKFCSCEFTGGIYRFKHHLARTHKDASACLMVPEDIKVKFQKVVEQMELAASKKRRPFSVDGEEELLESDDRQKHERDKVCQQIAWLFYTSALSFNCVKNPEFKKMIQMVGDFGRGLDPPSYHKMRVIYLKKEVDYTKALLEDYKKEWKKTGCTLMSDGWSDRKNRSICNFLVNSPKVTIFLASIDTSKISKTKEKVFAMLDDFVEKIGEEHIVQVVTDNAANYKATGEMLMDKQKKLFWTPCATHCIDLMLEDFEKKIEEHKVTIAKGRKITSFIYNRTRLICLLREFTKGKELLRPGATRFTTSYLTLGRLYKQKGSSNGRFRLYTNCGFHLSRYEESKGIDQIKLQKYEPIINVIDARWDNQLNRPLHVAGYFLNPRMQYSPDFKELKRFVMRVLSLTCSSSGCERKWSAFEMVEFRRIPLTGFRSCASRSQTGASQSRQSIDISSTKYYKDESCWNADVKSKTTEDFISNRSFMEVLVLNHYVLVKNVLGLSHSRLGLLILISIGSTSSVPLVRLKADSMLLFLASFVGLKASDNGPTISIPFLIKGHPAMTEVISFLGIRDTGEWIWHASQLWITLTESLCMDDQ
nr:hypothetical protein [Tanacetum cinerariifolium]